MHVAVLRLVEATQKAAATLIQHRWHLYVQRHLRSNGLHVSWNFWRSPSVQQELDTLGQRYYYLRTLSLEELVAVLVHAEAENYWLRRH